MLLKASESNYEDGSENINVINLVMQKVYISFILKSLDTWNNRCIRWNYQMNHNQVKIGM